MSQCGNMFSGPLIPALVDELYIFQMPKYLKVTVRLYIYSNRNKRWNKPLLVRIWPRCKTKQVCRNLEEFSGISAIFRYFQVFLGTQYRVHSAYVRGYKYHDHDYQQISAHTGILCRYLKVFDGMFCRYMILVNI